MNIPVLLLLVIGLILLVAGAEALVRGASRLAAMLEISPLIIGLGTGLVIRDIDSDTR